MSLVEVKSPSQHLFNVNYEDVKKIFFSNDDLFILVDGLALIFEASLNKHLKWMVNGSGVYLHAIYCIERILDMFIKLKSNIRIVFFRNAENIIESCECQSGRNDFTLLCQLVIMHLKSLDIFRNRLVFFRNFAEYVDDIKDERIVCYMGFSYLDIKVIPDEKLACQLESHFLKAILVNLNLGVNVILTKNLWFVFVFELKYH